jgi:hypothetical protein
MENRPKASSKGQKANTKVQKASKKAGERGNTGGPHRTTIALYCNTLPVIALRTDPGNHFSRSRDDVLRFEHTIGVHLCSDVRVRCCQAACRCDFVERNWVVRRLRKFDYFVMDSSLPSKLGKLLTSYVRIMREIGVRTDQIAPVASVYVHCLSSAAGASSLQVYSVE